MEHKEITGSSAGSSTCSSADCLANSLSDSSFSQSARPKMPLDQRAKQFLPFSALPGLDEALEAEARRHETI